MHVAPWRFWLWCNASWLIKFLLCDCLVEGVGRGRTNRERVSGSWTTQRPGEERGVWWRRRERNGSEDSHLDADKRGKLYFIINKEQTSDMDEGSHHLSGDRQYGPNPCLVSLTPHWFTSSCLASHARGGLSLSLCLRSCCCLSLTTASSTTSVWGSTTTRVLRARGCAFGIHSPPPSETCSEHAHECNQQLLRVNSRVRWSGWRERWITVFSGLSTKLSPFHTNPPPQRRTTRLMSRRFSFLIHTHQVCASPVTPKVLRERHREIDTWDGERRSERNRWKSNR